MSSQNPLADYLKQYPYTKYLDAFYSDLCCVMRGKRYPVSQAGKIFESGMNTPGSCFLLAVTGESMDPEGMGFSDGDPDEIGIPVAGTLSPCPWARVPTAQVMLSLQSLAGEPYFYEPRHVLNRVIDKFNELGLRLVVAFELEFYLLAGKSGERGEPLTSETADATQVYSMNDVEDFSVFLDEVATTCAAQGIITGAMSGEYAPGQFEINLQHEEPLAATDRCILFRRVVQCVARKQGYRATFMAKPCPGNAGSGLHLHISLLDESGNNVFDGGGDYGSHECATDTLRHAIGGLKAGMAESMAIFAPNVNSYHRFVPGIFVPVTPCWGYENRSVAMRIPKGPAAARRIEHRVAGADANPYLTLAAILAGIHHGITHQIDPGQPAIGNAGKQVDPDLPLDIARALKYCRESEVLAHYFGQDYLDAYTSCKLREYSAFVKSGDAEYKWYL